MQIETSKNAPSSTQGLPPIRVPFVDLVSERKEELSQEVFNTFRRVYKQSSFVLGEPVEQFEQVYAKLADCKYGVGVNSGTDAILLSLKALGIGRGDEVVTASNSFVASAGAIALAGATPVFAEIGLDHNLDPEKLESVITPKTKAVVPVHLTGQVCQMDKICAIAEKHGLAIVEDAAQAIGASYDGKKAGSFGISGCFSLHPLKNLHVWGDGGMVTTNDATFADKLKQHRNHGLKNRDEVDFFSFNSRLDTLQAVVGLSATKLLDETIKNRRANASYYDKQLKPLAGKLETPITQEKAFHTNHLYMITTPERDELQRYLRMHGVDTKIHYPIPIHLQNAAKTLGYKPGDLPVTERLSKQILSIPVRENLTTAERELVAKCIVGFFK